MKSFFTALVVALALVCVKVASIAAQTPNTINYQGRLTDAAGNPVVDGIYAVTFRIYDNPVAGTLLWAEPGLLVTVSKGLFTATLGDPTPFPLGSFDRGRNYIFGYNKALWLEIEVGGSPLAPRTKLESVPYAMTTGALNGSSSQDPDLSTNIEPEFSTIVTKGWDGEEKVRLWGPGWGELQLSDGGPSFGGTPEVTAYLSANANAGGSLNLYNNVGTPTLQLNGGGVGDGSAVLPSDAVNSSEILNEPGIAATQSSTGTILSSTTAVDIQTVTITIPAGGYIVVDAKFYGLTSGSTGDQRAWAQIDETAGGSYSLPHWTIWGATEFPSTAFRFYPSSVYRIFYKATAGTYTFRLEGGYFALAGGSVSANYPMIKATYFPTSYGTVAEIAPVPPSDHPEVNPVTETDPMSGQQVTSYTYDLRYYELQAQKAQAAAVKAQLELERARTATSAQTQLQPATIQQK